MALAEGAGMPQVRALATFELQQIVDHLEERAPRDRVTAAHTFLIANDVERYLNRPMEAGDTPGVPGAPPGSPIGSAGPHWLEPVQGVWLVVDQDPLTCTIGG
jgi:hypothetical protein